VYFIIIYYVANIGQVFVFCVKFTFIHIGINGSRILMAFNDCLTFQVVSRERRLRRFGESKTNGENSCTEECCDNRKCRR